MRQKNRCASFIMDANRGRERFCAHRGLCRRAGDREFDRQLFSAARGGGADRRRRARMAAARRSGARRRVRARDFSGRSARLAACDHGACVCGGDGADCVWIRRTAAVSETLRGVSAGERFLCRPDARNPLFLFSAGSGLAQRRDLHRTGSADADPAVHRLLRAADAARPLSAQRPAAAHGV